MIDLPEDVADHGSEQHQAADHDASTDKQDDEERDQYRASRLPPTEAIDRLDSRHLKIDRKD